MGKIGSIVGGIHNILGGKAEKRWSRESHKVWKGSVLLCLCLLTAAVLLQPGISSAQCSSLTCDVPQTGTINTPVETDCFNFSVIDNGVVHITVVTDSGGVDFRAGWRLLNNAGAQVCFSAFITGSRTCGPLPSTGNPYRIEVIDSNRNDTGSYTVRMQELSEGAACPHTSLSCDVPVSDTIETPIDSDLFSFHATHSGTVQINVVTTSGGANFGAAWRLLNRAGEEVCFVDAFVTGSHTCGSLPFSGNPYRIEVIDGNRNDTGSYTVRVSGNCACTSDAQCNDDLHCNGVETCQPGIGICVAGTSPCPSDGLFCTGTEFCNEATDSCQSSGDPCPNGLFCDGTESCNETSDSCQSSGSPCPPGQSCNDSTDTCASADHFKCYRAKTPLGAPTFLPRDVTLADQFVAKTAKVLRPTTLCNPVDKNSEGITDPTAHLTCYQIRDAAGPPRFTLRDVLVDNQFGQQTLTVSRAQSLCVPSEKDHVPSTLNFDHFKCYQAKVKLGTPVFTPREVTLDDQFEAKNTRVLRPVSVCNPVDKNGEGMIDPAGHLTCYQIRDVAGQPRFTPREVEVEDQFGSLTLSVPLSQTLCVPSLKTELGLSLGEDSAEEEGSVE